MFQIKRETRRKTGKIRTKETYKMILSCLLGMFFALGFCLFISSVGATAGFNKQINYQGKLTNSSGVAVPDGSYCMRFSIYDDPSAGNLKWQETWNSSSSKISIANGLFSVMLGTHTSFTDFFNTAALYLEIEFDPDTGCTSGSFTEKFSPRKKLGSVPSAMQAAFLEGATWAAPGAIGSTTPAAGTFTTVTGTTLTDGTFSVTGGAITGATGNISMWTNDSGYLTSITTHASSHLVGQTDTIFPADPNADKYLKWDDSESALIWADAGGGGVSFGTTTQVPYMNVAGNDFLYSAKFVFDTTNGLNLSDLGLTTTGTVSAGDLKTTVGGITLLAGQDIRPSANSTTAINIAQADGTDFVTFDTTNKRVGIGTTSPTAKLHIAGSADTQQLIVKGNDTQTANLQEWQNSSGTALAVVDKDGKVGIGTTSPTGILEVSASSSTNFLFRAINTFASNSAGGAGMIGYSDDGAAVASNDRLGFYLLGGSTNTTHTLVQSVGMMGYAAENWSSTNQGGYLTFATTPIGSTTASRTERMRIDSTGNVGIGTTSPTAKLHLYDTSSTTSNILNLGIVSNTYNPTVNFIRERAASANVQNGDIIGKFEWTPRFNSIITQEVAKFGAYYTGNGTTRSGDIFFSTSNNGEAAERMRITNAGNVGIGTSSPGANLQINDIGNTVNSVLLPATGQLVLARNTTVNILNFINSSADATSRGVMAFVKTRGTLASPTAPQTDDFVGDVLFGGYDGEGAVKYGGGLFGYIDGTPSSGSVPIRISFVTGTNNTDRKERLKIGYTGSITIPNDTASVIPLTIKGASSQTANLTEWQNSSGTALTVVDKAGNVGIGTTSPSEKLEVTGNLRLTSDNNAIKLGAAADASIKFTGTSLDIQSDVVTATDELNLRGGTNGIDFLIGATEQITLTDGVLAPTTDSDVDLGDATHAFKNLYADAYFAGATAGVSDSYNDGVDTTITFTGGIATAISTAFDENLMQDIAYQGQNPETELTPISFKWNELGLKQFANPEENLNVINGYYKAQDVQKFYPTCAVQVQENLTGTEETYLTYNRNCLTTAMMADIKTQLASDGTTGSGGLSGLTQSSLSQRISEILSSFGIAFKAGIIEIANLVTKTFTTETAKITTARMDKMEMVATNGDIYCTWINDNGDWQKVKGECSSAIASTALPVEMPNAQETSVSPAPQELQAVVQAPVNSQAQEAIEQAQQVAQQAQQAAQQAQKVAQQAQQTAKQAQRASEEAKDTAKDTKEKVEDIQEQIQSQQPETLNIISVAQISEINVAYGTQFADIGLAQSASATLSDNSTQNLPVTWDQGTPTYDGNTSGTYTFVGTISFTGNITNTANINATVNVIVGENQHAIIGETITQAVGEVVQEAASTTVEVIQEASSSLMNGVDKMFKKISEKKPLSFLNKAVAGLTAGLLDGLVNIFRK